MNVFWRMKTDVSKPFNNGDLRKRDGEMVQLSFSRYGDSLWYKEDEIEIIHQEESHDRRTL